MTNSMHQIRDRLNACKGNFPGIAAMSGLSYSWLCKFAAGVQTNPTFASLEKLERALDELQVQQSAKAA